MAPALFVGPVVIPGHRPTAHSGAYVAGVATYRCICGVQTPPAPPITAAALWREHLEINMARSTMLSGEPGQFAGKSIYERLWEEMDAVYGRLMAGEGTVAKGDKHYARGLAYSLMLMSSPYNPDIEAVKKEAHRRWEEGTDTLDLEHYTEKEN